MKERLKDIVSKGNRLFQDCFVIMPFSATIEGHSGDYWTEHFKNFLKPAIEQTGLYEVHRSKPMTGDILKQIIRDLVFSHLVVADLTDSNPNVYWELGVRQSFRHGTVTIAEIGTKLPFDLTRKGTLFYLPKDKSGNDDFLRDFQEAIDKVSNDPCPPDSEVLEAISGRGTFFEVIHRDEAIRRVKGIVEEIRENKNFLDIMKEALIKQVHVPLGYSSMQYCSLELLLTQRFLEEDAQLYSDARRLYFLILSTNSAISQYKDDWAKLTQFFSESGLRNLVDKLDNFNLTLEVILKKLENVR
jgi:hypothetical protein